MDVLVKVVEGSILYSDSIYCDREAGHKGFHSMEAWFNGVKRVVAWTTSAAVEIIPAEVLK